MHAAALEAWRTFQQPVRYRKGSIIMRVKIFVLPKTGVLDPQGNAIERSLHTLGYGEVRDVRVGKYLELDVDTPSRTAAELRVREMCDKLLANTVIEDYRFEISSES
jgi:phosphoribosylformylglycinamidine synthase subunit PurS